MASFSKQGKQENGANAQLKRRFQVTVIVLISTFVLTTAALLINRYQTHIMLAEDRVAGLSAIYGENLLLLISNVESILRATASEVRNTSETSELQLFVSSIARQLPQLRTLLVIDRDAIVIADSRPDTPAIGVSAEGRTYFHLHADADMPTSTIYIDEPVQSRIDGEWSLPLSIGVWDENDEFFGIVAASVDPIYFSGSLKSYSSDASISGYILNGNNIILTTIPYRSDEINTSLVIQPDFSQLDAEITDNEYEGINITASEKYILAYSHLSPYSYTVLFLQPRDEVLKTFFAETTVIFTLLLLVSSITWFTLRRQFKQAQTIQQEEQLRQQVQFDYQTLTENIPDFVSRLDHDLRYVYINTALARFMGISKDQYIGKTIKELGVPDELVTQWNGAIKKVFETGNPGVIEFHYETPEGKYDFQARLTPEYGPRGEEVQTVLSIVRDVSELKRIQAQLEANQKRLQIAMGIGKIGIYDHYVPLDENTFHSDSWASLLGYQVSELPSSDRFLGWLNEQVHQDDRELLFDTYNNFVEGRSPTYKVEIRLKHKQGHWISVSGESEAIERDTQGRVLHIIGVMADITEYRQMVKSVHQSEERFRRAVAEAPIPMMIHDEDDTVLQLSKGWTKLSGYTISDIPTLQQWTANAYGERQAYAKEYIDHLFEINETVSNGEWTINTKDNKQRVWDFTTTPLAIIHNTKRELLSIAVDVTERKQAEEALRSSELRFRLLAENAKDMIYRYRLMPEPGFEYVSPSATTITGYTPEEHYNNPQLGIKLVHPDDQHLLLAITENPNPGPTVLRWIRKDGQIIWTEQHNTSILNDEGEVIAIEGITRDITERKQAEQKIYRLTEHLEALVQERTAQLEMINQELNEFAYVVSHDLKAPLRGVTQLASWVISDYGDKLDEEGRDMLRMMTIRTRRMHDLIEGILQYSRIGRVREKHTEINLNTLVADVLELLAPPDNIEIIVHDLPTIWGENTRIQQVFQNLIGNAIKYIDRPDGKIIVKAENDHEGYVFAIADNGPGIEAKYHEKIFQLFQSLSTGDEIENTGIGLSLVKKIIDFHGGRIWLKSTLGEGTTFYFTLPAEKDRITDAK